MELTICDCVLSHWVHVAYVGEMADPPAVTCSSHRSLRLYPSSVDGAYSSVVYLGRYAFDANSAELSSAELSVSVLLCIHAISTIMELEHQQCCGARDSVCPWLFAAENVCVCVCVCARAHARAWVSVEHTVNLLFVSFKTLAAPLVRTNKSVLVGLFVC
jgi:hypothetical protein